MLEYILQSIDKHISYNIIPYLSFIVRVCGRDIILGHECFELHLQELILQSNLRSFVSLYSSSSWTLLDRVAHWRSLWARRSVKLARSAQVYPHHGGHRNSYASFIFWSNFQFHGNYSFWIGQLHKVLFPPVLAPFHLKSIDLYARWSWLAKK